MLLLTLVSCGDGSLSTTGDVGPTSDSASVNSGATDLGGVADIGGARDLGTSADAASLDASAPGLSDMAPEVCPRLKVTVGPGEVLNIRPTPSTAGEPVGSLSGGYVVTAIQLVRGEAVDGEDRWYGIESPRGDGYVHYAFVECTDDELTTMPIGWYMPFACDAQHRVTQGPGGGTSHSGNAAYAYDFACGLDTSIRAMRAGTVNVVWMETGPGDPCYNGGDSSCSNASNHIMIAHPNGQTSVYKHLNSSSVVVGQEVGVGEEIGTSGNTGWSTGPHLHIGVCDGTTTNQFCQTVDFAFEDIGRPANITVTSGNCP